MSTTVQADGKGTLHIPPSLLPGSQPLAKYRIETNEDKLIISKASPQNSAVEEFWNRPAADRIKALEEWVAELPPGPGLSDFAVSRESIYD